MKLTNTLIKTDDPTNFDVPFVEIEFEEDDPSLVFVEDAMSVEDALNSMYDEFE